MKNIYLWLAKAILIFLIIYTTLVCFGFWPEAWNFMNLDPSLW